MATDDSGGGGAPPIRLMNFISEDQLEEARRNRGARIEDGTAQRDKSLFEILKENKDKKDAEFNERFKHRPPKALDEDETEFLDTLEMSKREYERKLADKEAEELRSFRAAVAAQSMFVQELKESPPVPKDQDQKPVKKKAPLRPYMVVTVKPQAKRAKLDSGNAEERSNVEDTHKDVMSAGSNSANLPSANTKESQGPVKTQTADTSESCSAAAANGSLVSYSDDESD